jgi:hypothetical protein
MIFKKATAKRCGFFVAVLSFIALEKRFRDVATPYRDIAK